MSVPGRRIIVCGGRAYANWHLVYVTLDDLHKDSRIDLVIQGGANGADRHARAWAESRSIECKTVPAEWARLGLKAGPARNQQMIESGADLVVAFPGGRGTLDLVKRARKARIEVMKIHDDARACA